MPATQESQIQFWGVRPFSIIGSYPTNLWRQRRDAEEVNRQNRQHAKKQAFFEKHHLDQNQAELYILATSSENSTDTVKNGFCRVSWSRLSIPEKSDQIADAHSKFRCTLAFHYLMHCPDSRYSYFVNLRDVYLLQEKELNLPFEWSFPKPQWLSQAQDISGKGPTELATLETLNIVHILEQTVRGYLMGTNCNRWTNHIFNYNFSRTQSNVKNFFYRLEFQGRGTPHVHVLVWLDNLATVQTNLIRADIPWSNPDLAFQSADLQPSSKDAFPLNENPSTVTINHRRERQLSLYHPIDAFTMNLRAYLSTLLPFLRCRMDVQVTDHRSMILNYVTSYVSKFHDEGVRSALYSRHVTPYMAAYRHIADMKPLEPEMVISLSHHKPAWTKNNTKRYIPPRPENAKDSALIQKYLRRSPDLHDLSLLEWLRTHDTNKALPTPYKRGIALVGVKFVSVFNVDFFFQYVLLNVPFSSLEALRHPDHDRIPQDLQWYAAAATLKHDLWSSDDNIFDLFSKQGNKHHFVANVIAYFGRTAVTFTLHQQHRCSDEIYNDILNHLRHWKPTPAILSTLHANNLLNQSSTIYDSQIIQAVTNNASSTVLTVSRAAAKRVNNVIISHFFNSMNPLGHILFDDGDLSPVFRNMKIIITKNINKQKGLVNGQPGKVHLMRGDTLHIRP
ncbi:uncharacterized protein LOC110239141 [Exaiptasia diaphana]|uniref:Helitron helicase-like domain-containing protein n=1 Tax=Exaiptasia diaphana TaxID=2652724 RepID=A0A913X8F5_EXADI|nr:uncharacterized protein LOC110239141 [Exaiptasia diaphana]